MYEFERVGGGDESFPVNSWSVSFLCGASEELGDTCPRHEAKGLTVG